jgi:hypothetical protein
MKVDDMFSRRNAFHSPKTLWEDDLPEEFLPGLRNVIEDCFWSIGFQSTWVNVSNALGWPRKRPNLILDLNDDESLNEYIVAAKQRPWWELMDTIEKIWEETRKYSKSDCGQFRERVNHLFELRDVNWILDENGRLVKRLQNLAVIEQALASTDSEADASIEHLKKAWSLFNKRPIPDLANSVKEAVMAVESTVVGLSGESKGTLSDALKKLKLHPALTQSLEKLYGYRGDAPGVAHGASTPPEVSRSEAELVLTVCAGLVTFLRQYSIDKQAKK